ncbi:copper resistance CopC family protein [Microbacterium tumbae]
MSATALRRPSAPLVLAAALLTAALVLIPAARASAHDSLVSSDPAADSAIETLPEELTLTFSAALIDAPGGTAVVVTDAEGASLTDGPPEINGAIVTQKLRTDGAPAGVYTVLWQVVSSDGHPTEGDFAFTVATGSTASPSPSPAESEETAPTPEADASAVPTADDPNMTAGFSLSVPWLIAGAVVLLIAVFLVIVYTARAGRKGRDAGSDTPAEG